MSKLGYKAKAYLFQLIISVAIVLISLIGLFFGIWELVMSTGIASVFAFIYLFFMIWGANGISVNTSKSAKFLISTLIRFIIAAIGILIPALIIRLTEGAEPNKLRYLNVIAATIPFLLVNLSLNLVKGDLLKDGE